MARIQPTTINTVPSAISGTVDFFVQNSLDAQGTIVNTSGSLILSSSDIVMSGPLNLSGTAAVSAVQFDTNNNLAHSEGLLHWSATDRTIEVDTEVSDVSLQVGQELYVRVTNKTGDELTNGQVVYIDGAQGSRPTVALARANAEATADTTLGMMTHTLADNGTGYASTYGLVRDIDTSGYTAGDLLYLSADISGAFTSSMPIAPNHAIKVGYVIAAHATQGVVLLSIEANGELSNLHDVSASSPVDKQFLQYDGTNSVWQNVGSIPDFHITSSLYISGSVTNPDSHLVLSSSAGSNVVVSGTIGTQPWDVASISTGSFAAGQISYVSDGDGGSPCLAMWDGSNWKRISLGTTIDDTA